MSEEVPDEQKPIRVIRITTRLNVGGIARHVSWLSKGMESYGYQTTLVAGLVPPGEDDMTDFAKAQGVEPLIIPQMSRELSFRDLVVIWKLFRLFLRARPQIVHTHAAKAGAVGRVAGFLYRWLTLAILIGRPRPCRFVHTFHGHVFHGYYGKWKSWLFITVERILARMVTHRIAVISNQQYQEIHGKYRVGRAHQFAVVPLGLDLSMYHDSEERRGFLRDEINVSTDTILIGIVGRLTEIKNHAWFLKVAATMLERYPEQTSRARFLIIGDGHLREALEALSTDLNLQSHVSFLGMRHDPERYYPALDIVALTSRNEGTPLTLIEGMANARPAISTNVGGVVDLLGDALPAEENRSFTVCERGARAEPGDLEGYCAGLSLLIRDTDLRKQMGAAGQAFVRAHHSHDRLFHDIHELYRTVLN